MLSLSLLKAAGTKTVLLSTSICRRYCSTQRAQLCGVFDFFHFQNDVLSCPIYLMASCGLSFMLILTFSDVSPAYIISKVRLASSSSCYLHTFFRLAKPKSRNKLNRRDEDKQPCFNFSTNCTLLMAAHSISSRLASVVYICAIVCTC